MRTILILSILGGLASVTSLAAVAAEPEQPKPFVYEFYYKVKWGFFDEFLALYKKNHLPILKKQIERGEILSMSAAFPINHVGEDSRWDMRITVVFRDAIVAHEDPSGAPWAKALFPNQKTFKKEEQHRFGLVLEHMDIPIQTENPSAW
jgi:hypothetical protein